MIEIAWCINLKCTGGKFSVKEGTGRDEIERRVQEQVAVSIATPWAVYVAGEIDPPYTCKAGPKCVYGNQDCPICGRHPNP